MWAIEAGGQVSFRAENVRFYPWNALTTVVMAGLPLLSKNLYYRIFNIVKPRYCVTNLTVLWKLYALSPVYSDTIFASQAPKLIAYCDNLKDLIWSAAGQPMRKFSCLCVVTWLASARGLELLSVLHIWCNVFPSQTQEGKKTSESSWR